MVRLNSYSCMILLILLSCKTAVVPESKTNNSDATLPASNEKLTANSLVLDQLPHPSARELEQLNNWLSAQESGLELQRINDCQAQVLTMSDRTLSKTDLQKNAEELRREITDNETLYHWCYYSMMARLTMLLEQESLGRSYQDRLQQFLREGKALFILAQAMDRQLQVRLYRSTLQQQYMDLSQKYFGRNLAPLPGNADPESSKNKK